MALMHCPHCGAENFTVEGWEDLDRCSSCGEPLRESERDALKGRARMGRKGSRAGRRRADCDGESAEKPRPA
jgi:hypothetical protein